MKRSFVALMLLGLVGATIGFKSADNSDTQVALLKVESAYPGTVIEFEGTFRGDAPDQVWEIERHTTPFEMTVDAENIDGLFRQLNGEGGMKVTLSVSGGDARSIGSVSFVQRRGSQLLAMTL